VWQPLSDISFYGVNTQKSNLYEIQFNDRGGSVIKVSVKAPLVSVLLPVYNAEKYLNLAIESILRQSFKDFEFVIIDDKSTDSSKQIIASYATIDSRIKFISNPENQGGCRTLLAGLSHCNGTYIVRMDNDDWSFPDRLAKQVRYMESNRRVGILGGAIELINERGVVIGRRHYESSDERIRKKIFFSSPFAHPAVIIRRSVLDVVGAYNISYAPADDYELYFRIGKVSEFANLTDVILKYRVSNGSMTVTQTRKMEIETVRVRNVYLSEGSYNTRIVHYLFNFLHYLSVYIIPVKVKMFIFNMLRNER
jgi:glycosyltransferase involved in cell wall biosynthesis